LAGELPDAGRVNESRTVGVVAELAIVAEVLSAEAALLSGLSAETSAFIVAASFVQADLMLAEMSFVRATDDHLRLVQFSSSPASLASLPSVALDVAPSR
jgi:hypothetical protein